MISVRTATIVAIFCVVAACNLTGFPPLGWSTREEGARDCRFNHHGDPLVGLSATVLVEAWTGQTSVDILPMLRPDAVLVLGRTAWRIFSHGKLAPCLEPFIAQQARRGEGKGKRRYIESCEIW